MKLEVEIADTDLKRQYGLMDRHSLPENRGMLFKFPYTRRLAFWMQNTYIPLDIAFLDDDGTILQIEKMSPLSTRMVRSDHNCRYALEVNKDWFEKNNIKAGCQIKGSAFGSLVTARTITAQEGLEEMEVAPLEEEPIDPQQQEQQQPEAPPESAGATDAQINYTVRRRLQRINAHNRLRINQDKLLDALIGYQTEEYGIVLLPRVCRGPFTFEVGVSNGDLVRLMDVSPAVSGDGWECLPGEKTFVIDNIMWITEVLRDNPSQDMSDQVVAWYREVPPAQ